MENMSELAIDSSKPVVLLITVAALGTIFFVIGLASFSIGDYSKVPQWNSQTLVLVVSIAICLLPAYGIFDGVERMNSKDPAILLNSKGVFDNSSLWSQGFIPWTDIVKFSTGPNEKGSGCVFIHVNNPEKYIAKGNFLQRMASRSTFNKFGAPIGISLLYLDFTARELLSSLEKFHEGHVIVK